MIWPLLAIALFATMGRERGLIWSTVIGYLFLPEKISFNLPSLPDYEKLSAISLGLVLGALFYGSRKSWPDLPEQIDDNRRFRVLVFGLFAALCLGAAFTILNNGNALVDGSRVRSGLSMRDLVSMISEPVILMVPFFLAWRWLSADRHHREVLFAVVAVALFYSLLVVIEVRLSPQINKWVYGYFPHDWRQHLRGGGFRPVVFLDHGLSLGFFLLSAALGAFALFRSRATNKRMIYLLAGAWLMAVLLVSRNLGAVMLAFMFIPCLMLLSSRAHGVVVMLVAVGFLTFPIARQTNAVPLDGLLSFVSSISAQRAQSLEFRLRNEDAILARAAEKPAFGWGGWGRNRIIDERGRDTTVTDGIWAIYISERGWVGYISLFGILSAGLLFLPMVARRRSVTPATTGLALIMAANLVYLIPNSTLSPVAWLMAGALAALVQWRTVQRENEVRVDTSAEPNRLRYTRFAHNGHGNTAPTMYRRGD